MKFYAVAVGKNIGIYTDWNECKKQINGVPGAQFKSFFTRADAENYLKARLNKDVSNNNQIDELPLFNKTKMYTDGSYKDNKGGYGIKIIYSDGEVVEDYGKLPIGPNGEKPTNQRAELYAIKRGLEITEGNLVIYSDSMYAIKCMTEWIKDWKRNKWTNSRGDAVVNQDLIKDIDKLMKDRQISFVHVYAHKGIPDNERVDQLANRGRVVRTAA